MKFDKDWTSRKRVLTALEYREADRVPINFAGCCQTTVLESPPDAKACTRLYEYLGIDDFEKPVTGVMGNVVLNMDQ